MHRFAKFENPYLDKLPFEKPARLDLCGFYGDAPAYIGVMMKFIRLVFALIMLIGVFVIIILIGLIYQPLMIISICMYVFGERLTQHF